MPDVRLILMNLIPMLLSLSVHEFSHALVADRLGDDTPRRQGRLTLSPLAHYDIFGTFLVPIAATWAGGIALIGWARPVEISPVRLTRRLSMRQGSALVAMAGPLSNLLLATLAAVAISVLQRVSPESMADSGVGRLLWIMFQLNVGLCIFNLLPMPPLDGSHLLPRRFDSFKERIAPVSFVLILILLNIGVLREWLFTLPVHTVTGWIGSLVGVFG